MRKVVVIGGGNGLSTILYGIKQVPNIDIKAIVSVADDGGSTGKISRSLSFPAVGDIRRVLVSLSNNSDALDALMNHRFDNIPGVSGHSLGNLMLVGMTQIEGGFYKAVETISKILNVQGEVLPVSDEQLTLFAKMSDGVIVKGESNIPEYRNSIEEVFYQEDYAVNPKAIDAIKSADNIILGIGSLYTSIMPVIILEEIKAALKTTKAKITYLCNAMTQPGETDKHSVKHHVDAIINHSGIALHSVIVNNSDIDEKAIQKYHSQGSDVVEHHFEGFEGIVRMADLVSVQDDMIRHDPKKIASFFEKWLKEE